VTLDEPAQAASRTRQKRRPDRRDQILDIAVQLFYERGYHATSMDDIGRTAGITGPGIYRHFKSKEDILGTAIGGATDQILGRVDEIVAAEGQRAVLEGLIRNFARAVLNKPALAGLVLSERRLFPVEIRERWDRDHQIHLEQWARVLMQIRPDLGEGPARLMVHATVGLMWSVVSYRSGLERTRMESLLQQMALSALLGARVPGNGTSVPSASG
jgi:AcrR family transcriptional regulator